MATGDRYVCHIDFVKTHALRRVEWMKTIVERRNVYSGERPKSARNKSCLFSGTRCDICMKSKIALPNRYLSNAT